MIRNESTFGRSDNYPAPSEVTIEESTKFVSKHLLLLILWLMDKSSYKNVSGFKEASYESQVQAVAIAQFLSTKLWEFIMPISLALGVFCDHTFGSEELNFVLNSLGLVPNDDEIRRFKTSAAHHVLNESKSRTDAQVHIPPDITKEGGFIHEGDDNADVNCQTLDGKNTWHVLLRTLYQNQNPNDKSPINHAKIKKRFEKYLKVTPEIESLIAPKHYEFPKKRATSPRTDKAYVKIQNIKFNDNVTNGVCDMAWIMLRMISRNVLTNTNIYSGQ